MKDDDSVMGPSNIISIEPHWNERWGNDPDIIVTVDVEPPWADLVWTPDKPGEFRDVMLVSETFAPFVKFVFITKPEGSPEANGALGGNYRLLDGTMWKSRTGWSSRDGVINRDHRDMVQDEVAKIRLKTPGSESMLGGWSIYASALRDHPKWPEGCHLVRVLKFGDEPYHVISTNPDRIVKAVAETQVSD